MISFYKVIFFVTFCLVITGCYPGEDFGGDVGHFGYHNAELTFVDRQRDYLYKAPALADFGKERPLFSESGVWMYWSFDQGYPSDTLCLWPGGTADSIYTQVWQEGSLIFEKVWTLEGFHSGSLEEFYATECFVQQVNSAFQVFQLRHSFSDLNYSIGVTNPTRFYVEWGGPFAWLLLYVGFGVGMILLNVFLFHYFRKRVFWWYLAFLVSYMFSAVLYLNFQNILLPEIPYGWARWETPLTGLTCLLVLQYTRVYFDLKKSSVVVDHLLLFLISVFAVISLGKLFFNWEWNFYPTQEIFALVVVLVWFLGIFKLIKGVPYSSYFVGAWSFFVLGNLLLAIDIESYGLGAE